MASPSDVSVSISEVKRTALRAGGPAVPDTPLQRAWEAMASQSKASFRKCKLGWAELNARRVTVKGFSLPLGWCVAATSAAVLAITVTIAAVAGAPVLPATSQVCAPGPTPREDILAPEFRLNIPGQTGWFAAPLVADIDGDGTPEIILAQYDLFVHGPDGTQLARGTEGNGRVYAPHVLADLKGDSTTQIIVGRGKDVIAYNYVNGSLRVAAGFPFDTTTGAQSPEIRGMAAGDLSGDGTIQVAVSTTQTVATSAGGAQVLVVDGQGHSPAWPRYNSLSGPGNDADANGCGHSGYGAYGLNIAIGNLDDDEDLEIVVTYDNHHIQVFKKDGVALNVSNYYTNRASNCRGSRLTWGQFIRWYDAAVERDHYHLHSGDWPNVGNGVEWLQWTASPPQVADLDQDGHAEVIGASNVETHIPYETQAYALVVLQGAHDGGRTAGERQPGWEVFPRGRKPLVLDGWYPPSGVPAATIANILGNETLEIVVPMNDGYIRCYDAWSNLLWEYNYMHGLRIMYSSEVTVADLNQDGIPELVFSTYGDPDSSNSGYLVVLAANGALLHDIPLPNPGHNGNGNGAPSAPTIADTDGDGQLEILVQTFDHGVDIFTVPGSATNCLLWPTARGGPLRQGRMES